MAEMKTLNGYEVVDEKARQLIAELQSSGGGSSSGSTVDLSNYYTKDETYSREEVDTAIANNSGGSSGSCNIPFIPQSAPDISTMEDGIYAIKMGRAQLSNVTCSELNANVGLQWWVSNGMLLVREKMIVAWGQDQCDIMFYVFNMNDYQDQSVTLAPTSTLKPTGWEGGMSSGGVDETKVQEMIDASLGVIENGSY